MTALAKISVNFAAVLLLMLLATVSFAREGSEPTCVKDGQQNPELVERRSALEQTPTMLGKRMELANLLQKAGCFDEALNVLEDGKKYNPFSPTLLIGLRRARIAAREEHYRESADLAEASATLNKNMQRCAGGDGISALQACQSALVKGAPNEFDMTVRIALLQQSINQFPQALESYIAANSLHQGDKVVALAILALLDSTQRKDGIALAARGSSLVALGRGREAVAALRQAKSLQPELPDIDQQLLAAEALAHSQSPPRKERALAGIRAAVESQTYSNVAEATHSN